MSINIKLELHVYFHQPDGHGECYDSQTLRNKSMHKEQSIISLMEQEIIRLKVSKSPSTINNYQTALHSFSCYEGHDLLLKDISSETIQSFERQLYQHNVGRNTISCYMRSLRSLLVKISGKQALTLFSQVYTGRPKTEKRAIAESDLLLLKNVELKQGSFLSIVRDLFLFSFYALGMPFVDMAFLKQSNITDGRIVYYRHKTGSQIAVKLEPCMNGIIKRYQINGSVYVFPLIQSEEPEKAYNEYLLMLNRYNRALKELAKKAGVNKRLTSYTPRHTWASTAFNSNVDLPVISKALGHTNPQTTLTYIKEIDDKRLEEVNRLIVTKINGAADNNLSSKEREI